MATVSETRPALPRILLALAAGLCLAAAAPDPATPYPGGVWQPGPAGYGWVMVDDVPVTMDDGVVLHASIFYPADPATGQRAAGPFPVVIEHSPYTKATKPGGRNTYLVEHGYIYVVVRPRGTGTSEGEVQFFSRRDGFDGKAIVDWAAHRLEGSDGRVALVGCSYPAGTALATAAEVGPGSPVKAVIAACDALGSGQPREMWLTNGLPNPGFGYAPRVAATMGNSPASVKFFGEIAAEIAAGGDRAYDREFWRSRIPMTRATDIVGSGIPVLLWSGWKDIAPGNVLRTYVAFQNAAAGRPLDAPMTADQPATARYQLIMGDWTHGSGLDGGIYLQWLETWVKGVKTGIQDTRTPLHVFETGSGRWTNIGAYAPVADATSWYLQPGVLQTTAAKARRSETLSWGDARLSFLTPPIARGATLAGPISATLYARSSNTNLLLIAKLYDVAPDGKAIEITKGAVLGSLRTLDGDVSWTDRRGRVVWPWPTLAGDAFLTPGQVYRLNIALTPHQHGLAPGHRLRLDLSTQSPGDICPVAVAPDAADKFCTLTAPQRDTLPGGRYEILYGPGHPSELTLPQLEWQAFPTAAAGVTPTADSSAYPLPLDWGPNR